MKNPPSARSPLRLAALAALAVPAAAAAFAALGWADASLDPFTSFPPWATALLGAARGAACGACAWGVASVLALVRCRRGNAGMPECARARVAAVAGAAALAPALTFLLLQI